MAVEEELGTSDEIKEFKHEGDLETHKDALLDIKNALVMAADKPPLAAALDYILQMKGTPGIPPVVIEVANRLKQEQLMRNSSQLYASEARASDLPTVNLAYGVPAAPKLTDFPTICLPSHIPNVNAATLASAYARPNWATQMLVTSSQSATQPRSQLQPGQLPSPYYYNQPYPQHFGAGPGSHLLASVVQQPPPQQSAPTKGKGSKAKKKSTHIKKPLNAFMLYMKEMRAKVVQEYTLKESAAINQILGKRWHALDRSEQARFYELARRERALHMQMYPNWSARSNYASTGKKKRKRDKAAEQEAGSPKKCRARYGLDKQSSWCKPCRRKKKCVRYLQGEDIDCKDGLGCDADNDHHKPSCPAAHEPGCSIRDCSCDCNTHTCGGKFENAGAQTCGNEEKEDCTCKKEEVQGKGSSSTPNVVVCDSSKSSATTLHLASVANLSLTREASVTSVSSNMTSSAGPCSSFGRDQPRIFLSPQGAPEFGGQPGNVSTLSHYPNN